MTTRSWARAPKKQVQCDALFCMFLVGALGIGGTGCPRQDSATPFVRFTPVDDGIEYARFRLPAVSGQQGFDGHAFRVDLSRAGLRVLPAGGPTKHRDVQTTTRALDRLVAVNGSFFDPEGRAMGLVVDEGRLISRRRSRAWGALMITERHAQMMGGGEVDLKLGPSLVLQGQPRLVKGGAVPKLKPQSAKRTVICLGDDDAEVGQDEESASARRYRRLTLVVTSKVDASRLGHFLAQPANAGGMGCTEALNLDGGPSTQLVARLGAFKVEIAGASVPNALVAIPGLPAQMGRQTSADSDAGGKAPSPEVVANDAGAAPSLKRP